MTSRPWLLIVASAVTAGALFGWIGSVAFALSAAAVVACARQPWVIVLVVTLVAGTVATMRVSLSDASAINATVLASSRAEVVVADVPASGPSGPRAVVDVERVSGVERVWHDATGKVLVFFRDAIPGGVGKGDRLMLVWDVDPVDAHDADFRSFILSSGASGVAHPFHVDVLERGRNPVNVLVRLRNTVTGRIEAAIPGDAGSLLAGFVTGDDSGLSAQARRAFDRTSTSHITAVSGSNVAVLVAIWLFVVRSGRLRRSWTAQLAIVGVIWCYVLLVGLGPGAVRAGLFATLMLPAARFGRKPDALTALVTASAVMLLVSPGYAGNAGFWLSMAASAAMVTVLTGRSGNGRRPITHALLALGAAQASTLPITVWVFDGWSPASIMANLLVGPLVTLLFPIAFVTAVMVTVFPWLGDMLGWIPELGATALISMVESLSHEFPMVRTGSSSRVAAGLIAVLCAAVIAVISVDVDRFVVRVAAHRSGWPARAPALLLGASAGVWIAVVVMASLR